MIEKPFDKLSFADVEALVAAARPEDRRIEFKRDLPSGNDAGKKEFLADVSSLANTLGGDLIFGIDETAGVASAVPGVAPADADAEILRLENLVRDGIQPRIIGLRSAFLANAAGGGALVVRVPASLQAPHRVVFQNWGKFFNRSSRGKSEMDVLELREAFIGSDNVLSRIRNLHGKLRSITHVQPLPGPQAVITVAPLAVGRRALNLEFTRYEEMAFPPLDGGIDYGQILEGALVWAPDGAGGAYAQALSHRAGYVEAMEGQGSAHKPDSRWIWPASIAKFARIVTRNAVERLSAKGVEGPWVVMFSLTDVLGYDLYIDQFSRERPTVRDRFDFREIIFEDMSDDMFLPLMKQVWWAFGRQRPDGLDFSKG